MLPKTEFDRFRTNLSALPLKDRYARKELRNERFRLFRAGGLDIYYAPFHYLNKQARVALIGLTPGWTQMERAFWAARQGMGEGLSGGALFRHIELSASFSGPMRGNLVAMLEGIGLHDCLKICCCDSLFQTGWPQSSLVHFTSVVSAPIFQKGRNYGGYGPHLLTVPRLNEWVATNLVSELTAISNALLIPLGKVANEVLKSLCDQDGHPIEKGRCLLDFPHPSGANGHRSRIFEEGRTRWKKQARAWFR